MIPMQDNIIIPMNQRQYSVLERLANTGIIRKGNTLLDYGCGKGRVDFFLAYQTRCRSIGVEYDERIYNKAIENKEKAISAGRVAFKAENAEYFLYQEKVDRIYFFNPFSLEILQKSDTQDTRILLRKTKRDKTTVLLSVR